jgi:hypothetical protein
MSLNFVTKGLSRSFFSAGGLNLALFTIHDTHSLVERSSGGQNMTQSLFHNDRKAMIDPRLPRQNPKAVALDAPPTPTPVSRGRWRVRVGG